MPFPESPRWKKPSASSGPTVHPVLLRFVAKRTLETPSSAQNLGRVSEERWLHCKPRTRCSRQLTRWYQPNVCEELKETKTHQSRRAATLEQRSGREAKQHLQQPQTEEKAPRKQKRCRQTQGDLGRTGTLPTTESTIIFNAAERRCRPGRCPPAVDARRSEKYFLLYTLNFPFLNVT